MCHLNVKSQSVQESSHYFTIVSFDSTILLLTPISPTICDSTAIKKSYSNFEKKKWKQYIKQNWSTGHLQLNMHEFTLKSIIKFQSAHSIPCVAQLPTHYLQSKEPWNPQDSIPSHSCKKVKYWWLHHYLKNVTIFILM